MTFLEMMSTLGVIREIKFSWIFYSFRVEKIGLYYQKLYHFERNKYVIKTVWNGYEVKNGPEYMILQINILHVTFFLKKRDNFLKK